MGRLLHALSYMITDHLILLNYNKYTLPVHYAKYTKSVYYAKCTKSVRYADYNLTPSSDYSMMQCA